METRLLEGIGLTKSEAKVYLALLELGSSPKGKIVDVSGVASSKVYELLEKLAQKGLVGSVVKGGVKHFEAAPPSRIMDFMKEKKKRIEEEEAQAAKLVPQLERLRSTAEVYSETTVFKGMKGAETSFNDILESLRKGQEYYVLGISKFSPAFQRFVVNFHHKRAGKGIKCKVILNELAADVGRELEAIKLTSIRYVPKELFTPVVFIVYGEKTLISIGLDLVFIQIVNEKLASGLKAYAEYMFRTGKKSA